MIRPQVKLPIRKIVIGFVFVVNLLAAFFFIYMGSIYDHGAAAVIGLLAMFNVAVGIYFSRSRVRAGQHKRWNDNWNG